MRCTRISFLVCVASFSLLLGPIGCKEQGPAERAGERIDDTVDNIKEGEPPFQEKGAFEETGEAIDEELNGE